MQMARVIREPKAVYLLHWHPTTAGFMKRRLGDNSGDTAHKILWRYYAPRGRWEAVCEFLDVVFYCEGSPKDV